MRNRLKAVVLSSTFLLLNLAFMVHMQELLYFLGREYPPRLMAVITPFLRSLTFPVLLGLYLVEVSWIVSMSALNDVIRRPHNRN